MQVYRSNKRPIIPAREAHGLVRRARELARRSMWSRDDLRGLLIDAGEFEAAVVDRMCPSLDRTGPVERACRELTMAVARLAIDGGWIGSPGVPPQRLQALCHAAERLQNSALPALAQASRPEGYAYYCVYPDAYAEAAADVFAHAPRSAPISVVGLRSIGTGLSAIVAAALEARGALVESWTVRPRGHPFARRIDLDPELAAVWQSRSASTWVVVDEGPGLSGSSIAGVAECLARLGVNGRDILLMPNYAPDVSRFAEPVADRWRRHCWIPAPYERLGRWPDVVDGLDVGRARDGTGGQWRDWMFTSAAAYPAVHPAHERRKWRMPSRQGSALVKFAGLGQAGARNVRRAVSLADAGWSPPVEAAADGFLRTPIVAGLPLVPGSLEASTLDRLAEYLALVARMPGGDMTADGPAVEAMALQNVEEALGQGARVRLERMLDRTRSVRADQPAIRLDNRMRPHEFILDGNRLWKTDGYEHDDDHFFPGPYDIAWDVAATLHEFRLSRAQGARLVERYEALSGDRTIAIRLRAVTPIYLAARLGYASLAAAALTGTEDGARMAADCARCTARLRSLTLGREP